MRFAIHSSIYVEKQYSKHQWFLATNGKRNSQRKQGRGTERARGQKNQEWLTTHIDSHHNESKLIQERRREDEKLREAMKFTFHMPCAHTQPAANPWSYTNDYSIKYYSILKPTNDQKSDNEFITNSVKRSPPPHIVPMHPAARTTYNAIPWHKCMQERPNKSCPTTRSHTHPNTPVSVAPHQRIIAENHQPQRILTPSPPAPSLQWKGKEKTQFPRHF